MAGTNADVHGLAQLGQVADRPREGVEDRLGHVLVQLCSGSNGDGIAIDHIETFLVDVVLALRLGHFLLAGVPQQLLLKFAIRSKAGPYFVVVHTFLPLVAQILGDVEVGMLSRLDLVSLHFEGKGPEVSEIDSSSTLDVLFDVVAESPDD